MAEARVGEERVPVVIARRLEKKTPGRQNARAFSPFPCHFVCPHEARAAPNVTNIEEVEERVADA
jgi:hypothetical protein